MAKSISITRICGQPFCLYPIGQWGVRKESGFGDAVAKMPSNQGNCIEDRDTLMLDGYASKNGDLTLGPGVDGYVILVLDSGKGNVWLSIG